MTQELGSLYVFPIFEFLGISIFDNDQHISASADTKICVETQYY